MPNDPVVPAPERSVSNVSSSSGSEIGSDDDLPPVITESQCQECSRLKDKKVREEYVGDFKPERGKKAIFFQILAVLTLLLMCIVGV